MNNQISSINMFPQVSVTVDVVPLLLVLALVVSAGCAVLAMMSKSRSDHTVLWTLGAAISSLGLLLLILRGKIPDIGSILLGNCILLIGECLLACGTSRYIGRRIQIDITLGVLATFGFAAAYFAGAGHVIRVAIYATGCAAMALHTAIGFFQARRKSLDGVAGLSAAAVCLIESCRAILVYSDAITSDGKLSLNAVSISTGVVLVLGVALAAALVRWDYARANLGRGPLEPMPTIDVLGGEEEGDKWVLPAHRSSLVGPGGVEIRLTGNEYIVLQKLGETSDAVDRLTLNALIGRSKVDPKDRGIDILFSRLRRKCAEAGLQLPVNSVRGRGYVFLGSLQRL